MLRERGFVVYLETTVDAQLRRLARDRKRPLLRAPDRRERLIAARGASANRCIARSPISRVARPATATARAGARSVWPTLARTLAARANDGHFAA